MARKVPSRVAASGGGLRDELERLGVAPAEAGPLAERLRGLARALTTTELRVLLDGAATVPEAPEHRTRELRRILEDFAAELKKLDEGLRLITAYLTRLRDHTAVETRRTLH